MKNRIAIAAALLMSVAGIGSSPANAYVRNAPLVILTVTCSATNNDVYVAWSKDVGKPYWVAFTVTPADQLNVGGYGGRRAIPGSRGSKGNWTVSATDFTSGGYPDLDTSQAVRAILYNKDLSVESVIVTDTCE